MHLWQQILDFIESNAIDLPYIMNIDDFFFKQLRAYPIIIKMARFSLTSFHPNHDMSILIHILSFWTLNSVHDMNIFV